MRVLVESAEDRLAVKRLLDAIDVVLDAFLCLPDPSPGLPLPDDASVGDNVVRLADRRAA